MTYPNQPDFTSVSDDDAWWLIGYGSPTVTAVCSVGGRAFVDLVQMILGVNQDGRWGSGTSTALISALRAAGASSTLIGGVQAEAASRRVSISSVRGAIFLMHRGQSFGGDTPIGIDEGSIAVQPNAVFPQWDVAAPLGPSGDMPPNCVPQNAASTPGSVPAPSPGQPIPSIDVTVPPLGTPPGNTPSNMPSKQPANFPMVTPSAPAVVPRSSNAMTIGLVVVGLVAIGGIIWWSQRSKTQPAPGRARRNPHEATLRSGDHAFYDSFAGLVPVKILSIKGPESTLGGHIAATSEGRAEIRMMVTASRPGYPRGFIETTTSAARVVPRGNVRGGKRRSGNMVIDTRYTLVADTRE